MLESHKEEEKKVQDVGHLVEMLDDCRERAEPAQPLEARHLF